MSTEKKPLIDDSISNIAFRLSERLTTEGYSLILSDVETAILEVARSYYTWHGSLEGFTEDGKTNLSLDNSVMLTVEEWSIMEMAVKARCDVLQANRTQGMQNLGMQPVGLTADVAQQNHKEALAELEKKAFNELPFSVEFK